MQDHGLMVVRYQSIITENDFPIKTVLGLVVITNWCSNWWFAVLFVRMHKYLK